ncbi:MAG TPA: hypothetical protein DD435_14690 [Cyanobacteria bacterium UBA8530]|nr:hypothetical protein [Cyanobacteria bacterium UBA8530]
MKSGSLTKEVLCKTVDLEWSPTPPSAFTTAPYYIPGVDGCDPSKGVSLTGYYLEDGGRQIKLMKSDFEWIFQPTGFAFLEGSYDQKIRFKGGAKTGTTQIGATLKCDPRQTFSFNVSNVKIEALNLKYSLDTYQWATPATAVAGSIDLPLGSGKVAVIKVDSVSITGGQEKSVGNDWAFNNNLSWTSGTAGIVSTEIRSDKTVVVTPLALGTTTLQVVDSDEPNKAKVVTINVVNQQ